MLPRAVLPVIRSNEGRCCDAVLTVIEMEHSNKREILSKDTPASRGVEIRCKFGHLVYALEHTIIDAYPDKRGDDQQFLGVMGELEKALSGKGLLLREGWYELSVESHAFRGMKRSDIPPVREAIRNWVICNAMHFDPPGRGHTQEFVACAPTVPVRLRLQCTLWPPKGDTLRISRFEPAELPEQRRVRMRAAVEKKGPKLEVEHRSGAHTVLILEDADAALSNHIVISTALRAELTSAAFGIDDVYLVETKLDDRWLVWRLKQGEGRWPTRFENPPMWELSVAELKDILAP